MWATHYEKNETIHVIRTGTQRSGLTQGAVRQLAQWFDDILICWYVSEMDHRSGSCCSKSESGHSILAAYAAAFLSVIALQEGTDVSSRRLCHE